MLHYSQTLDNRTILDILRHTCGHVDARLIDHGVRVAWLVSRLLALRGDAYTPIQRRDACMLAVLHDIGAYKTEDIDHIVSFETNSVWGHAIYGSLFLQHFSPFGPLADAVLFHHAPWQLLEDQPLSPAVKELAQFLSLADRTDIFLHYDSGKPQELLPLLESQSGTVWSPDALSLLRQLDSFAPTDEELEQDETLYGMLCTPTFSPDEVDALFKMLIYIIDFRSRHTVTHTITTASVSKSLAELMDMDERTVDLVVDGSLLHDLGKVGIPVEILEFPGKLSPQAMAIMRTHVDITEEILGDCVTEEVKRVALRHHEKLDGSGYPRGLTAEELTTPERVVAAADIISALCGTRSYKDAYSKLKTLTIIQKMADAGLLDRHIVSLMASHFDEVMASVRLRTAPLLSAYHAIATEYEKLMEIYA